MAKKVRLSGRGRKAIRLLDGERAFVGVDVHKATYSVSVWTDRRDQVAHWVQPADPMALVRRLAPVRSQLAAVVYEAGPTGFSLARTLRQRRLPAEVVAPSKTPTARGPSSKCDRLDAGRLAFLASKAMLTAVYVPSLQQEADRQVVRRRHQLARERRRLKHRINSFLLQHQLDVPGRADGSWGEAAVAALRQAEMGPELRWCLDSLLDDLAYVHAKVRTADAVLAELLATERHTIPAALLDRVGGVGTVTIATFLTEVPCPGRFATGEQVASFVGLAPRVRRSGSITRSGPIVKAGNTTLRSVLIEAAWSWVRRDPVAKALFRRLLANTASGQKAIVGVARHLAVLLWRIVTTGEVYEAHSEGTDDDAQGAATDA
jgi:transposase